MKENSYIHTQVLWGINSLTIRPVISGISAAAMLLVSGCATHQPAGVMTGDVQPLAEALRVQLGTIALVSPSKPAAVRFDQPEGQAETFGDGASVAAARMLDPSGLSSDPAVQAVAGVAGFVVAPVAAVVAGSSAAHARLAPDKLSGCESNLLYAMNAMAAQEHFRNWLVKAANEKTRRRLILVEPTQTSAGSYPNAETVLETQVQDLRLERIGKSDTSYALRIKASVRLVRTADGAVLYERPVEYRSGTCLFLDWTLSDSFQKVAETGYREMAELVVNRLLVATPEGPLLAGRGNKKSPAHQHNGAIELADRGSVRQPTAQPVSYSLADTGSIHIISKATVPPIGLPTPVTIDEAALESAKGLEQTFDGWYNYPNLMISLPSIAVAIPWSLWNQVVAGVCALTERQARQAETQLRKAAHETRPHEELAKLVAEVLTPQTSQLVILEKTPLPFGAEAEYAVMPGAARLTPVGLRQGQTAADYLAGQEADTVLEIIVVDARLTPKGGVNPPMALCVEAEVRLLRARDGEEIYSCPIAYRSQHRKFTKWAAHDAQLFRQELRNFHREVSTTIVDQLVSHGLVAPSRVAYPTLAGNPRRSRGS